MNYDKLNVVLHTDEAFSMQACTMILSVCENNRSFTDIAFYVLDTGIKEKSKANIVNMLSIYGRKIYFLDTQEITDSLKKIGIRPYQGINMGVYLKGMLSRILPPELEQIIYIDCDAIVNGSLQDLWSISFNDKAIGMAVDCMNKKINEGYGFKNQYYYNTGVMLINLPNWISRKCEEKYNKYILENNERIFEWADQDLINASLNEDTFKISPRYNWISLYEIYSYEDLGKIYGLNEKNYYTKGEYQAAHEQPIIYHFPSVFIGRPWYKNELLKNQSIYDKYLYSECNPWNNYEKKHKKYPIYTRIQRLLYKIFPNALFVLIHHTASMIFCHKITKKSIAK